jgi:hypothetical protein
VTALHLERDLGRLELACRDLVLEENVELSESPSLALWETQVRPNKAEEAGHELDGRSAKVPRKPGQLDR